MINSFCCCFENLIFIWRKLRCRLSEASSIILKPLKWAKLLCCNRLWIHTCVMFLRCLSALWAAFFTVMRWLMLCVFCCRFQLEASSARRIAAARRGTMTTPATVRRTVSREETAAPTTSPSAQVVFTTNFSAWHGWRVEAGNNVCYCFHVRWDFLGAGRLRGDRDSWVSCRVSLNWCKHEGVCQNYFTVLV